MLSLFNELICIYKINQQKKCLLLVWEDLCSRRDSSVMVPQHELLVCTKRMKKWSERRGLSKHFSYSLSLSLSLGFLTASPCITVALLPNESVVLTLPWRTWWRASREGRLSGFLGSFERTHRYFTWRTGVERRKGLVVLRKGYGKWGGWDENKKWWEEWDEVCCVQSSKWWILSTSMWRVQCLF